MIPGRPVVAILLCTFQGRTYLEPQLESFASQRYWNWKVWSSDDGSQDGTVAILHSYRDKWGADRISVLPGPGRGVTANFLSLACNERILADYYAYSDQDDIWDADKLERALEVLRGVPEEVPALYCSRARLIDEGGAEIGLTPSCRRLPSFRNALVQNLAGGNTMVFNRAARDLLCEAGVDVDVPIHDWWTYLVVTGCGGAVIYDNVPTIGYRQHGRNIVGVESGPLALLARSWVWVRGDFRKWNDCHVRALARLERRLTPQNRETLASFDAARGERLVSRLTGLRKTGIHRQNLMGNLALFVAAVLGKI